MLECHELEVNGVSHYIKFKHNESIGESGESEQGESEEATGGETAAEQIFLETTV
jgi:hypothetical protein